MKNIGIFYLILVLLLTAVPCSDAAENYNAAGSVITEASFAGKKEATENCSSICLCTCCGQSIVAVEFISYQIKNPVDQIVYTSSTYYFKLELRGQNIWQPPKLA